MEPLILIAHVLAALAIIGLILIQQGKGADMGASFGSGASQTLFGSTGGGNALTKATALLATVFFATSFGLAIVAKDKAGLSADIGIPTPVVVESKDIPQVPVQSDEIPALDEAALQQAMEVQSGQKSTEGLDIPAADSTEPAALETEIPE
jgi:preprotein translocase subunit SecG